MRYQDCRTQNRTGALFFSKARAKSFFSFLLKVLKIFLQNRRVRLHTHTLTLKHFFHFRHLSIFNFLYSQAPLSLSPTQNITGAFFFPPFLRHVSIFNFSLFPAIFPTQNRTGALFFLSFFRHISIFSFLYSQAPPPNFK